jgi:hypothetical protein
VPEPAACRAIISASLDSSSPGASGWSW